MINNNKSEEWTVKLGRLFGVPLAKAIVKLPFKVHPNVISILSLIPAFIAGYLFFNNLLVLGAIFFWISYILDCADGTLARLTNTASNFGKKLDFYIDITGNIFMYFGLWYSQYYLFGDWFFGGIIIFAHYCVMIFGYMFITDRTYKTIFPSISSYYSAADEGLFTFMILPILGIFRLGFPIVVSAQFISYLVLFLKQNEKPDIIQNIKNSFKLQ